MHSCAQKKGCTVLHKATAGQEWKIKEIGVCAYIYTHRHKHKRTCTQPATRIVLVYFKFLHHPNDLSTFRQHLQSTGMCISKVMIHDDVNGCHQIIFSSCICACTHTHNWAWTWLSSLSMQHPPDLHEHLKIKQASRGEWPPLCARPQGIHSPRLSGTRKAKKSATRDLRYDDEMRMKCLCLFFMLL